LDLQTESTLVSTAKSFECVLPGITYLSLKAPFNMEFARWEDSIILWKSSIEKLDFSEPLGTKNQSECGERERSKRTLIFFF